MHTAEESSSPTNVDTKSFEGQVTDHCPVECLIDTQKEEAVSDSAAVGRLPEREAIKADDNAVRDTDQDDLLQYFELEAATRGRRTAPLASQDEEDVGTAMATAEEHSNQHGLALPDSQADSPVDVVTEDGSSPVKERSWTEIETDLFSETTLEKTENSGIEGEKGGLTEAGIEAKEQAETPDVIQDFPDLWDSSTISLTVPADPIEMEWGNLKTYDLSGPFRGKVLIIQMENFSAILSAECGLLHRPEAEVDGKDLKFRLRHAGFHVQLVKDPSREEVINLITDYTTIGKLDNAPCLMVVIMTHACIRKQNPAVPAFALHDGFISQEELIKPLADCPLLRGKPKIFIFQACKITGKSENLTGTLTRNTSMRNHPLINDSPQHPVSQPVIWPADVLVVNSAVAGYGLFKNARSGALFLQLLARALDWNIVHPSVDFVKLLVRINGQVASSPTQAEPGSPDAGFDPQRPSPAWAGRNHRRKQTITFTSTLTKALCLF